MYRDNNDQMKLEQDEQSWIEEMLFRVREDVLEKQEIATIRAKEFEEFVQSHEKAA